MTVVNSRGHVMQLIYDKGNLKVYLHRGDFRVHRDGAYIGVYFKTQGGAVAWCDAQLGFVAC